MKKILTFLILSNILATSAYADCTFDNAKAIIQGKIPGPNLPLNSTITENESHRNVRYILVGGSTSEHHENDRPLNHFTFLRVAVRYERLSNQGKWLDFISYYDFQFKENICQVAEVGGTECRLISHLYSRSDSQLGKSLEPFCTNPRY